MCGFAGYFGGSQAQDSSYDRELLRRMADAVIHRGPDDAGYWTEDDGLIGLAHRRLSIVDLSSAGHQPMHSGSGRYVIVFNGEIYNHQTLRKELESLPTGGSGSCANRNVYHSRGHSDTDVMLGAFERWGIEGALLRFNGMFAFALWDRRDRVLHLARDRFGEKPLYYGWMGDTFLFGSQLKALKTHPAWRGEINRDVLALYMQHNCVPAPYSIYRGIHKLLPGHFLTVSLAGERGTTPPSHAYWSARQVAEHGSRNLFAGSEGEAADLLDQLLRDAVRLRMEADVPLGAFLSGGIDSSTVVALMQAQATTPTRTFSVGVLDEKYDEAGHARAVARHLGTDHTEIYVTPKEAQDVIPHLPDIYDEPFADSSQIPTYLVSKLTRRYVTVALSGDGGDELFGGYNRHVVGGRVWKPMRWIPRSTKRATARALTSVPPDKWDQLFSGLRRVLPDRYGSTTAGDKVHKLADLLTSGSPEELYLMSVTHWEPQSVVLGAAELPTAVTDARQWARVSGTAERMMFLDLVTYLPDDILAKVDRASMAVSLEARVPLLDHRVAEFAWSLPESFKIRNGTGKWLLRKVLSRYVPRSLTERPKMGFGVPIDAWLRGPLREWSETLLNESRLQAEGFFNPAPIRKKWNEHLLGRRNWAYHLWDVLMFEAWLETSR